MKYYQISKIYQSYLIMYLFNLLFAVLLLKEEEIDDLRTAEIKSIWALSCCVPESNCHFRASEKNLQDVFRRFHFNKVVGQKVY